jgi:hypothetical protein
MWLLFCVLLFCVLLLAGPFVTCAQMLSRAHLANAPWSPCRSKITSLLQAGTTIVMDRYTFSGVAFTAAKVCVCVYWVCDFSSCI